MPPQPSASPLAATAPCTAHQGVVETTGEQLSSRVLTRRIGWAIGLVQHMTAGLLADHWNPTDVAQLAGGTDHTGRRLPTQACKALRRLGWRAEPAEGIQVNDRVIRMAEEAAGRILRSAVWRAGLVDAVVATWPQDPANRTPDEWDALRAAVPGGQGRAVATGMLRGRTRQITDFLHRHGRLPTGVFELEAPPHAPRQLLLAPCDQQQATLARYQQDPDRFAVLRIQLPTRADPRSYRDWTWVAVRFALPPTVPGDAKLHLPTLRIVDTSVRVDLPFTRAVPAVSATGHTVALGVDWGLNCLLTAGVVHLTHAPDDRLRCTTDNRTVMFRADGILAKADRIRRAGEAVSAKVNQHRLLLDGRAARGLPEDPVLQARHDLLTVERDRIAARRRHLNAALANACANWLVEHVLAAGVSVIYFEDLRDLEARGKGRNLNTRLSQTVRGQLVAATRHAAAKHGIAVVIVPARETSKRCPRCLTVLRHSKAPDQPGEAGWKWARCPSPGCGYTGDRDVGAWQRIAARGLVHQHQTVQDPTGGQLLIRKVDPDLDARSAVQVQPVKTPAGNTASAPAPSGDGQPSGTEVSEPVSTPRPGRRRFRPRPGSHGRGRRPRASSSRGMPRQRRAAPSPPRRPLRPRRSRLRASEGRDGHRPEGRVPQDPTTPAASAEVVGSQAAVPAPSIGSRHVTIGTASRGRCRPRHRPRGARLGAGFHLGVHATPPRSRQGPILRERRVPAGSLS